MKQDDDTNQEFSIDESEDTREYTFSPNTEEDNLDY